MIGYSPAGRDLRAIALLGGLLLSSPAFPQTQPSPKEARIHAKRYAPILWLAPGELAYPMLPFPFAFDGIDNDEDGVYDLADPDEVNALEIAPGETKKQKLIHLEALLLRLQDLRIALRDSGDDSPDAVKAAAGKLCLLANSRDSREPYCPPPSQEKRVPLKDFKLCEEFLGQVECGPGAAVLFHYRQNLDAKTVRARDLVRTPLDALQYWMYYPWDDEHLHDGEHVSVFFSRVDNEPRVEAVVGAGHLPSTANNVLARVAGMSYPSEIPPHMPILVEMGKHSSAPDLNCNGAFDVGQDSNWLPTGAWGTRDINYAIRKSAWTRYEHFHSFDRTRGTILVEASATRLEYEASCSRHSLGGALLRSIVYPDAKRPPQAQVYYSRAESESTPQDRHPSMAYRLLDAETLEAAFKTDGDDLRQKLFDMQGELFPPHGQRWRSVSDVSLSRAFLEQLDRFRDARKGTNPRPDIWNHSDYGEYDNDFKAGLFRRFSVGSSLTVESGNSRIGGYLRFAPKRKDSSFELHVWADWWPGAKPVADANADLLGQRRRVPLEAALLYNAFSTSYNGLYVGASLRSSDLRYTRAVVVPRASSASSGQDVVLRTQQPRNAFVEAGYAFAIPVLDKLPLIGKLGWIGKRPLQLRVGVAGPMTWTSGDSTDTDARSEALRASKWPQAVELRVTVQFRITNIGKHVGGHPLQRAQ